MNVVRKFSLLLKFKSMEKTIEATHEVIDTLYMDPITNKRTFDIVFSGTEEECKNWINDQGENHWGYEIRSIN